MAGKVVVHDVSSLSGYCQRLSTLKQEMETTASKLATLSEELKTKATSMGSATEGQNSNWQDPQYEKLKSQITPCISAINTTSTSVKETSSLIKNKMAEVDTSIAYIKKLIQKLNEIS